MAKYRVVRSTKAERLIPATPRLSVQSPRIEDARSTKAERLIPATPQRQQRGRLPRRPSLNEGREVNPGDTSRVR